MKNKLEVITTQDVLGKQFSVYGTPEKPFFLAKDVAEMIDYDVNKTGQMLSTVDEDEKLTTTIYRSGQNREMWFLTEYGLYEVLMQSRKPIAKQFKKEVKKVLVSIRLNGGYIAGQENMSELEILANAQLVAEKIIKRQQAELEHKDEIIENLQYDHTRNKNLAIYISRTMDAPQLVSFKAAVNLLDLPYGPRQLIAQLRDRGIIDSNNMPSEKYRKGKYFAVKQKTFNTTNGGSQTIKQTFLTQKGLALVFDKLVNPSEYSMVEDVLYWLKKDLK